MKQYNDFGFAIIPAIFVLTSIDENGFSTTLLTTTNEEFANELKAAIDVADSKSAYDYSIEKKLIVR